MLGMLLEDLKLAFLVKVEQAIAFLNKRFGLKAG